MGVEMGPGVGGSGGQKGAEGWEWGSRDGNGKEWDGEGDRDGGEQRRDAGMGTGTGAPFPCQQRLIRTHFFLF